MKKTNLLLVFVFFLNIFNCQKNNHQTFEMIAELADGWSGQIVSKIDQSYAGWDVEIGDADNDGKNEILTTGCPDSRLYLLKNISNKWRTTLLDENLAQNFPGMGLVVKVVDLNMDGMNEILVGTGQEKDEVAFFYIFQMDGEELIKKISNNPMCENSNYTHNFAVYDCDGDSVLEVFSAYCGSGEITRYDVDKGVTNIRVRMLHQLSGSGEESLIADVDNDGKMEYITSNAYRDEKAKVEIFDFDGNGELIKPATIVIDGFDNKKCFYASIIVGDVNNDSMNELIVAWKRNQKINKTTLLGYCINEKAVPVYTFAYEDADLDLGYFEKMMAVADADNDGKNELVISTRGDNMTENITSLHLGQVFLYKIDQSQKIQRTVLVNFNTQKVESSWLAVGDADNDGRNEIVLSTGKGDRTKTGISYVVLVEK